MQQALLERDETYREAKARLTQHQADKERSLAALRAIEVRIREGQLVEREEIERDLRAMLVRFRQRFMGLGPRIAAMVPGELKSVVKQAVEAELRVALKEMADAEILD